MREGRARERDKERRIDRERNVVREAEMLGYKNNLNQVVNSRGQVEL